MREQIYSIMESDPETIFDPMSVDFSTFEFTQGYYNHRLTQKEIEKSYILSYQYYGDINYEDIILLVNNIPDIFEVPVGVEIKIPKINDINAFILKNTK